MSWEHVVTHILVDCEEYRWELEEHRGPAGEQMLFAHIILYAFSPGVLKRMQETYRLFRKCVSAPLYAVAGYEDDDKWEKFISHFGFKYLTDVVCVNGVKRRLFVSFGNQEQETHEPAVLPDQERCPAGYPKRDAERVPERDR